MGFVAAVTSIGSHGDDKARTLCIRPLSPLADHVAQAKWKWRKDGVSAIFRSGTK